MRIALIAGDGVGREVTAEAVKVVDAVSEVFGHRFDLDSLPYGADHSFRPASRSRRRVRAAGA